MVKTAPPESPGRGFQVQGPYPPGEYKVTLGASYRTPDRLRVRLRRELRVTLRAGETLQQIIEFVQDEIDEAQRAMNEKR